MADPVSRSSGTAAAPNTVVTRTVEVYLQMSPQTPAGGATARGINQLDWRVVSGGSVIASGQTTADGKVIVPLRNAAPSQLQLLFNGHRVATYTITERTAAAEAVTTLQGQQRRLRSMGYHLGSGAVDGQLGPMTDRAILELQGDEAADMTGVVSAANQTSLTNRSGY